MNISLSDVSKGWKVYILSWFWVGVMVWFNESIAAAVVTWAVGASAGWLLAPTVRKSGWSPVIRWVRYLTAALFAGMALWLGALALEPTPYRQRQTIGALVLSVVAVLLWDARGFFRVLSALDEPLGGSIPPNAVKAPRRMGRPSRIDDTHYRCPACDRPTGFGYSDGLIRCEDCGHTFPRSGRPSSAASASSVDAVESLDVDAHVLDKHGELAPTVKLVNVILTSAIEKGASEILIEPNEREVKVKYRIDGALYDVMDSPIRFRDAITSRVKVMAKLDTAQRQRPQEGQIRLRNRAEDRDTQIVVSCSPTRFGESIRLALVDHIGPGVME